MSNTSRPTKGTPKRLALIELDRWQLGGILILMLLLTTGAFFIGVKVGQKNHPNLPQTPALAVAPAKFASSKERQNSLAQVWPPTSIIDRDLSRPIEAPLPSNPTERARAVAHQQLQHSRSGGLRVAGDPTAANAEQAPVVLSEQTGGYTLQISIFDSQNAANAIAGQLLAAGHPIRIRQVRSADGRELYRVEVGQFSSDQAATAFQRKFERESGYSVVLVPL